MRFLTNLLTLCLATAAPAADLESRVLTHYVPQDFLEIVVRTEDWTEVTLNVKGGARKGDVVRIWAGGSIDYGNGDQPGENITNPHGLISSPSTADLSKFALSTDKNHAFSTLFKTEAKGFKRCVAAGKPLEITLSKDKEKLWIGFNDLLGRYQDNHLGKGRRHELDPMWIRIEVVRTIVD